MRLQSVIIPDKEQCSELYFRGSLTLAARDILTFDTYFNSFSYTKYREYTTVKEVCFSCKFSGRARVELCVFDGKERIVCGGEFSEGAELSADLSALPEHGFLYPKITALTDVSFEYGEFRADCEPQKISCCIAICTYKRESYVLKNTALLRDFRFSFIDRVFVIDNGNTLDCGALSDDFIKALPNRNFGGSGGFTRGLIEAQEGGFSHVILMDDDVEFHPETLEKMTVFTALLKQEYSRAHFGTAMLSRNVPCIQYELGGADWNGRRVCKGKHNIDVRAPRELLANLTGNEIGYGAWWCFLLPVSDVKEYGLPYPFFIKIDDVEYGLRTCKNTPIITMNGAAVRHDDFDNKFSMHLEYYNVRNQLVMNAAQNIKPFRNALYRLFAASFKQLVLYRYDCIPLILRAFEDFLAGVDFFLQCDEENLNREIMQNAPKPKPLADIPEWDEKMRGMPRGKDNKILTPFAVLTFAGHLIPTFMLKKGTGAAPLSRAGAADALRRRAVVQYQLGGDTGILTERSVKKFAVCSIKVLGMAFRLMFSFGRARKSFRARKGEISSVEFWRRHLASTDTGDSGSRSES